MRKLLTTAAAILALGGIAWAGNTVFFTNNGDITFPFSPPAASGTAGAIDNMVIGATTPRAGTFTTVNTTGTSSPAAITGGATPFPITGQAAASATSAGGAVAIAGAAGGATSGTGGAVTVTGGAGSAGNANGGDVTLTGGALNGSGANGVVRIASIEFRNQGAPTAATTSATLTAAQVLAGIITVNQGGAGASAQQLPAASAMDTALPSSAAGDAFDFSVINISTVAAEAASVTTNSGWTLVGDMDIIANSASTTKSAGRFRARKTGTGAWVLYRLS